MKTRRLNIGIRSDAERSRALHEAIRRVARGDHTVQEPELYFENVEKLRQMLTEKRLDLLSAILQHRPVSVHQLAELVQRDYKNVSTDVMLLAQLGLVSLEAQGGKGRAQAPIVPYDEIQLTINLRRDAHAT
jgi:predicted transcriptional regulator